MRHKACKMMYNLKRCRKDKTFVVDKAQATGRKSESVGAG